MARQATDMSGVDTRRFQYCSSWHGRRPDGRLFISMIGGHYRMDPGMYVYRMQEPRWRLMVFHDPAQLDLPTGRVDVAAESLVVWHAGAPPQAYGATDQAWSHSWIACVGSRIDALMAEAGLPVLTPVALPSPAIADRTLLGLQHELSVQGHPDPGIQESLLRLLLLEARRSLASRPDAADPEGLLWVRRHLDRHLDRPVLLDELAREHGVSIRHLVRRFTATWGLTPTAYHLRARMTYARTLLDQPQTPLERIARTLGYADAFAFSKAFKRHVGTSPERYRQGSSRNEGTRTA